MGSRHWSRPKPRPARHRADSGAELNPELFVEHAAQVEVGDYEVDLDDGDHDQNLPTLQFAAIEPGRVDHNLPEAVLVRNSSDHGPLRHAARNVQISQTFLG